MENGMENEFKSGLTDIWFWFGDRTRQKRICAAMLIKADLVSKTSLASPKGSNARREPPEPIRLKLNKQM